MKLVCGDFLRGNHTPSPIMSLIHLVQPVVHGSRYGTGADQVDNKPPLDLEIAKRKLDFPSDRFDVLPVGRTIVVD